jgi:putative NIF3 family GTP cyclohydrolase 1 type 2
MQKKLTATQLIDRIRVQCGDSWRTSSTDIWNAGNPDTIVTGVATSYTPSIDVLQRAVEGGKNLIITQQPVYYGETAAYLAKDPAYLYKKELIEKNDLVVWRFYENWNSRRMDGQLRGLAKALGWEKYHLPQNNYFQLPETTLRAIIPYIEQKLGIKAIRVIGDPYTRIRNVAVSHGMFLFSQLLQFLSNSDVDLIVVAEAIEWESPEYFRDLLTWKGNDKAMILLGREASEDPGYGVVATWLKTFIPEVPIDWLPAGEPFWVPSPPES